ncbi:MAG: hypothetical protein KDB90_13230 [Planctomycetes bacterium]|nr:hypothetical protein [Planctomycetota bacterium]
MRHAREDALNELEPLIIRLRRLPGLRERKRGTFYRGGSGFLHFHEDPAGLFADLKVNGEWIRMPVDTKAQRDALVRDARNSLT